MRDGETKTDKEKGKRDHSQSTILYISLKAQYHDGLRTPSLSLSRLKLLQININEVRGQKITEVWRVTVSDERREKGQLISFTSLAGLIWQVMAVDYNLVLMIWWYIAVLFCCKENTNLDSYGIRQICLLVLTANTNLFSFTQLLQFKTYPKLNLEIQRCTFCVI